MHNTGLIFFSNLSAGPVLKSYVHFLCGQLSGPHWHCSSCKTASWAAGPHPCVLSLEESESQLWSWTSREGAAGQNHLSQSASW